MRTVKELFELMLRHQDLFPHGLCDWVFLLFTSDIICRDERNLLENYIDDNKPEKYRWDSYWWEADKIQPRLDWINEQIEKLSKTTLDFSKYKGTHSIDEMKSILDNMKSDILKKEKEIAIKKAQEIHKKKEQ